MLRRMTARCFLCVLATLLVACGGKSNGSSMGGNGGSAMTGMASLGPCDPLAAITSSFQLEASQVVAAGQAEDGSIYVVYDDDRLFVGSREGLLERVVVGFGQTGDQMDLDYTDDGGSPVKVEVVTDAAGMHMAVAHGMQSSKGIDEGEGEPLELLDAAVVASLSASTTQTFNVDFAASLDDGREVVVVAPDHRVDDEHFRVFLGVPPAALEERSVSGFYSTRSGQRSATIMVDGAAADLTYLPGGPSVLNPTGGPTTLTIAGTAYPLTEQPVPDGVGYLCFSK